MIESQILEILQNYGFPIFVCLWFMFRTEKIINRNTEAIERLADAMEKKK